jgi:hypothetical protein
VTALIRDPTFLVRLARSRTEGNEQNKFLLSGELPLRFSSFPSVFAGFALIRAICGIPGLTIQRFNDFNAAKPIFRVRDHKNLRSTFSEGTETTSLTQQRQQTNERNHARQDQEKEREKRDQTPGP